jgi:hypothetical protein
MGLDDRKIRVLVPAWANIFYSPRGPNQFWDPPNLLSNGYRTLLRVKATGAKS